MTTAIITAYIVGVIVSYLFNRWVYSDQWTVSLKTRMIMFSILSWLAIIVMLTVALYTFIELSLKNNDKAKW